MVPLQIPAKRRMETLTRLIDTRAPISPDTPCGAVAAMFDADPALAALGVVDPVSYTHLTLPTKLEV